MRSIVIAFLIVGLVACGGKSSGDKAGVETYLNQDMNALIGVLWVGKKPLMTIKATHMTEAAGWFEHPSALDTIVIPRMTEFLDGANKVTPPASMKAAHAQIIEIATAYRTAATDLGEAAVAKDQAKFTTAHAALMEAEGRYQSWQHAIDEAIAANGITLKDPPVPAKK